VIKRPGREADHSPPFSTEVKNAWSYTSAPQYAFVVWCSFKKTGRTLYLYLTKNYAMKTCWRSGGTGPRVLNRGNRWRWEVSFTPWPLYPRYPLDRKLGRSQSRSGRGGEENRFQTLPGIENQSSSPQRGARKRVGGGKIVFL